MGKGKPEQGYLKEHLPSSLRMIDPKTVLVMRNCYDPMLTKITGYRDHECNYVKSVLEYEQRLIWILCKLLPVGWEDSFGKNFFCTIQTFNVVIISSLLEFFFLTYPTVSSFKICKCQEKT